MELNFENQSIEEKILTIAMIAAREGIFIDDVSLKEDQYRSLCLNVDYGVNSNFLTLIGPIGRIKVTNHSSYPSAFAIT